MAWRSIQKYGRLVAGLVLACSLGAATAWAAGGPRQGIQAAVEDPGDARVIVKYRSGSTLAAAAAGRPQHAARLGRQLTLAMQDGHVLGRRTQSLRANGLSSSQLALRLAALPEVEWAVPARRKTITAIEPNDPFFGDGQASVTPAVGQWYLRTPDATLLSAVNALGAWAISTGSAAMTVAVLDTGVVKEHPDLAGKLHPGYDFVSRSSASNDDDGRVVSNSRDADASDPGDWSTSSDSCGAQASSWHGTQVAGLIGAATDNGIGMAGIGRQVMVLPVRVLGKCGGYDDDIIAAMRWASGVSADPVFNAHPARVLNLSLGSSGACSTAYREAIAEINAAGVVVVVAAGNDTGHAVNEPANCPGAIAVAGLRHAGTKVGYSNIGPEVAIAAPAGNCVNERGACLYPLLTTTNASSTSPGAHIYSDSFKTSLGTSFAAPMVAGTAALMLSVNPRLTPGDVKTALQSTARAFPITGAQTTGATACAAPTALDQIECYCSTSTCGAGQLDAGAAVEKVAKAVAQALAVFAVSTVNPTVGSSVTLDGGPSSVAGDRVLWSIVSGAGKASFTGSGGTSSRRTSLSFSGPGAVVVRLQVATATGASSTADKTLTAVLAPTASFVVANPYTTVGAPVGLNAAASVASTGRTVDRYLWTITGTTAAHFTTASNASTATLQADQAGDDLSVTLTVTDSAGETSSASQSIAVAAAPEASFTLSTSSPAAGTTVTLDGSASSAASGHSLRSYAWSMVSGGALASFNGAVDTSSATLAAQGAGVVVVRLTVVDDAGARSSSDQTVVITPPAAGGGGALGWGWAAGLALAVLALSRRR